MLAQVDELMRRCDGEEGGSLHEGNGQDGGWVPWADRPLEPSVCELILSWDVASVTRLPPLPQFGGRSASDPQAEAHAGADEGERNLLQSMMERPAGFAFSLQNALRREQHDAKGKISQSKPKSMSARRLGECWPR